MELRSKCAGKVVYVWAHVHVQGIIHRDGREPVGESP